MTVTEPDTTIRSGDALTRVHHHCEPHDLHRVHAGEAVWSLCGLLKRRSPDADDLPCCPMCADIIHARGGHCFRPGGTS